MHRYNSTYAVRCFVAAIVAGLTLLAASQAYAQIQAFNSFGVGEKSATPSNSPPNYWCVTGADTTECGPTTSRFVAVPFVPSTSGTLDYLDVAASYFAGTQGAIVSLVADNGGSPAPATAVLETFTVTKLPVADVTDLAANDTHHVKLTSKLKPALVAGTSYWLMIAPLGYDSAFLVQGSPTTSGSIDLSLDGGQTWAPPASTVYPAFNVYVMP